MKGWARLLTLATILGPLLVLAPAAYSQSPGCTSQNFTVQANQTWQDTGVRAESVQSVTYVSGQWTVNVNNTGGRDAWADANGHQWTENWTVLPSARGGSLVGRAG